MNLQPYPATGLGNSVSLAKASLTPMKNLIDPGLNQIRGCKLTRKRPTELKKALQPVKPLLYNWTLFT